jgi:aminoglycoside 2''-phosphotransferase
LNTVPDLNHLARPLRQVFPDLPAVEPLTVLGSGFSSLAVETAGGLVFRIARTPAAGLRYVEEYRILPLLQPHVPVTIPLPEWYLPASADFPFGLIGYRKLPGVPLDPAAITAQAQARDLAAQIGALILALHRLPVAQLALTDDFERRHAEWSAQRDTALPALRAAMTTDEYQAIARWWDTFLVDDRMRDYQPAFQHGDLWFGNLLVEGGRITGLVDFENAGLGDPALDFVPGLYLGAAFLGWMLDAYRARGGVTHRGFQHRLRQLFALREFSGAAYAVEHDAAAEWADSLAKLRRGPLLSPAGLDGWAQVWR